MKITSDKEILVKGIQTLQSVVSSKTTTLPILQNFLMETDGDGLRIVFTNLEMAVKHFIPVQVKEEGSVTAPLKKFMEMLQTLSDGVDVTINTDENSKISVNSGKTKFRLSGSPKTDYPLIPEMEESGSFSIPAGILSAMVNATIFSASVEDERQFLNGLLWKYEKGQLSVVATDGRRLALATDSTVKAPDDFKIIIPSKVMGDVVKFIKSSALEENTSVTIGLTSNQVGIRAGKTVFISRLVEGQFPAYEQIIPKSNEISVSIDADSMTAVTRRAAICAGDRGGSVCYLFKKGIVNVTAESQVVNFEDEQECSYEGEDFQIKFNPKFVMDVFKSAAGKKVLMSFSTPSTPAMLKVEGEDSFLYIIMPLRN